MRRLGPTRTALLGAGLILSLAACSTKAADDTGGDAASGELKTDVGVTADTITLTALTDLSGTFKVAGIAMTKGNEIWVDEINKAGGICDRDVVLDTQDTGYKVDNAVPMYDTAKGKSLGLIQLVGSHITAALKQRLVSDKVLSATPTAASANLDTGSIIVPGVTYDVEMINAMYWLQNEGKIADGDTVGLVYLDSEMGQNALLGAKYYADKHKITLSTAAVSATDVDMTTTVTKMKSDGVKAIFVAASPNQLASVALQNKGQGLAVPVVGAAPTYSLQFTTNPDIMAALQDTYTFTSSSIPTSSGNEAAAKVAEAYDAMGNTDPYTSSVLTGYLAGLVWEGVLNKACENGDMTREGVLKAREELDSLDTKGITAELDLSDPGAPPTRKDYMVKVSTEKVGGTELIGEVFEAPELKDYKTPYQK